MLPQDVSNFDTVFTTEAPLDSVVEGSQLSQTVQAQFAGKAASMSENEPRVDTTLHYRVLLRWHAHARQPIIDFHAVQGGFIATTTSLSFQEYTCIPHIRRFGIHT